MNQKNKKNQVFVYEGYLTIEASLVIPVAVMILVQLLFYGFYCYDKSVSVQCCYLAGLRASNEWELTNTQMEQAAYKNAVELAEEKFLFIKPKEQKAEVFMTNVKVELKGSLRVLFVDLAKMKDSDWGIDSQKSAIYLKPSSYIRRRK